MEIFFIAIPPKKVGGDTAKMNFLLPKLAFPLALAWQYYSIGFLWKKVG